jgi:hypothetical protein
VHGGGRGWLHLRLSNETRRKCGSENKREKESNAAHKGLDAVSGERDANAPKALEADPLPEKGHHYR